MTKAGSLGIVLIATAWVVVSASVASAQMAPPPAPSTSSTPSAAMLMNPYLNPAMNPLLNPAAPQQKMGVGNSLLYLYSANAARGGIGSGRLSNPGPSATRKKPAHMPNAASVPGGAAARYFNNSGAGNKAGVGRYYNQRSGYFQNTGN